MHKGVKVTWAQRLLCLASFFRELSSFLSLTVPCGLFHKVLVFFQYGFRKLKEILEGKILWLFSLNLADIPHSCDSQNLGVASQKIFLSKGGLILN